MPPRRIPPPQRVPDLVPTGLNDRTAAAPRLDGLMAALQGVVRRGVQQRQQSAVVPAAVEARMEAKVEALLHDTVIPHVGNQAEVYEWMERAQRPFDTPEEEEAFYRHVREASGSDEMVFMLRWGLMDTREGDGATADALVRNLFGATGGADTLRNLLGATAGPDGTLLRNMFGATAGPDGGADTLPRNLLGATTGPDGTQLRNLLGATAGPDGGAGAPRKTLQ